MQLGPKAMDHTTYNRNLITKTFRKTALLCSNWILALYNEICLFADVSVWMLIRPQSLSFRNRVLWAGLGSWFRSPINYFMGFVHVWGHIVRLCVLKCAGHFASSDLWLSLQHSVFYTQAVIYIYIFFFPPYCTTSLSWCICHGWHIY